MLWKHWKKPEIKAKNRTTNCWQKSIIFCANVFRWITACKLFFLYRNILHTIKYVCFILLFVGGPRRFTRTLWQFLWWTPTLFCVQALQMYHKPCGSIRIPEASITTVVGCITISNTSYENRRIEELSEPGKLHRRMNNPVTMKASRKSQTIWNRWWIYFYLLLE